MITMGTTSVSWFPNLPLPRPSHRAFMDGAHDSARHLTVRQFEAHIVFLFKQIMVILKEMDKIAETTKKDIQSSDFSNMFLDPNK